MTRVLLIAQDKGGVGKTLIARALAELVPAAPLIEIDTSSRLLELEGRTTFFPMRADRAAIEKSGGKASRAEFDPVVNAIEKATQPTIVDVGANTAKSLLALLFDVREAFEDAKVELGLLVIVTAEQGARTEAPALMKLGKGWMTRFLLENRLRGSVDPAELKKIADGAAVSSLDEHFMEEEAVRIVQTAGLAIIPELDGKRLREEHGSALGVRIARDLTQLRANAMETVRGPANWLVGQTGTR